MGKNEVAPIEITEATFNTTLNMGENAVTAPKTTFKYTVTAGEAKGETVLAGIESEKVKVKSAKFTTDDILGESDDKFVKQSTINFSDVKFTKPGVYHYILTAKENGHAGVVMDDTKSLDVYVYVINVENENSLMVSAIVIGDKDYKYDGFEHDYVSEDLVISKTVTGNMGDKNKDFTFTPSTDSSFDQGTIFKVTHSNGTISYIALTTDGFVTVTESNGTYEINDEDLVTFTLKNGETYTIHSVVKDMSITVTETAVAGYTTTVKVDGVDSETTSNVVDGNKETKETTDFTNDYTSDIPETGVILNFLPLVMMVLLAGGLLSIRFVKFSKKS